MPKHIFPLLTSHWLLDLGTAERMALPHEASWLKVWAWRGISKGEQVLSCSAFHTGPTKPPGLPSHEEWLSEGASLWEPTGEYFFTPKYWGGGVPIRASQIPLPEKSNHYELP